MFVESSMAVMSPAQQSAARTALAQECERRDHVVVYLSGSHAYGFPSPDSDLDLKASHVAPTRTLVGLRKPKTAADRLEVVDGIEIDYTSNEIGMVLSGILGGNGNYIERVLGPLTLISSPEHEALRPLVQRNLSRRIARHYAGFANSQLIRVNETDTPTAKKILYLLRTALTGTHALLTGELVIDVRELLDPYGFADAAELIELKLAGERTALEPGAIARWRGHLSRAMSALDDARARSVLPEEPAEPEAIEGWLLDLRRARW